MLSLKIWPKVITLSGSYYFYLIKKLVELSQFEQISISVWQCDCASIEKGQNPMFQLIDDVLAKVAIRSSIPRQRCRLRKKLEKKVLLYIKKYI